MNVLVLGSGAREHALAWKLSRSRHVKRIYTAPGNAGTLEVGDNLEDIDPLDFPSVERVCRQTRIDVVVVGPEDPLTQGIVDYLEQRGIAVIGPSKEGALLEASKCHAKKFLHKHGIPTAAAREFKPGEEHAFASYVDAGSGVRVVKKSGLAAGKGVLVSEDTEALRCFGEEILKDDALLVEESLEGFEVSVFAVTDGTSMLLMPPCADYKRARDGDVGPNTGGMGSICPVPSVSQALMSRIRSQIVEPTFAAIRKEGLHYRGFLYFGLMVCRDGPQVLEYNVRLGDPETQALLPVLEADLGALASAVLNTSLNEFSFGPRRQSSVAVVVASGGYPQSYKKGVVVDPIPSVDQDDVLIFHASTGHNEQGALVTGGGRCFSVVGLGPDLQVARQKSYAAVKRVHFEGSWFRSDIGAS